MQMDQVSDDEEREPSGEMSANCRMKIKIFFDAPLSIRSRTV